MKTKSTSLALLLSACAMVTVAQAAEAIKGTAEKTFEITLAPGKIHEECRMLNVGEAIDHRFKADTLVAFNVHFHKGEQVEYPVKVDDVTEVAGTFRPKVAEHFCWMWKNTSARPAKVTGAIGGGA